MRKYILFLLGGTLAATLSVGVLARGGGPGGGGGSHTPSGPPSKSAAAENSNGRFAKDRDKGLDRAQDRMSQQGLAHQKATDAQKAKGSPVPATPPTSPKK